MKKIRSPVDLRDLFVFGGLGAVCYGVWQVRPWAAFVVGGLVVLGLGLFPTTAKPR